MNDLLKLTSEMVSNINNTSTLPITNSTWKSPIKDQENKLEEIHQKFLKAQTWGKNLKSWTTINNERNIKKRSTNILVSALTEEQIRAFTPYQIESLTQEQIQSFEYQQIPYFTQKQIQALTEEQKIWFFPWQIKTFYLNK